MKTKNISNNELIDMFEGAFDDQVAIPNDIAECEVLCERSVADDKVTMTVDIFGMAGSPTMDDFKLGRLQNVDVVTIERYDIGSIQFNIVPQKTTFLNATDYQIVYEAKI